MIGVLRMCMLEYSPRLKALRRMQHSIPLDHLADKGAHPYYAEMLGFHIVISAIVRCPWVVYAIMSALYLDFVQVVLDGV